MGANATDLFCYSVERENFENYLEPWGKLKQIWINPLVFSEVCEVVSPSLVLIGFTHEAQHLCSCNDGVFNMEMVMQSKFFKIL